MAPRFQFRLRTLMIVVTLLAVPCWWVATQRQLVQDRLALLQRVQNVDHGNYFFEQLPPGKAPSISGLRRLLGDQAISNILLPLEANAEEYAPIHAMFPEAQLQVKDLEGERRIVTAIAEVKRREGWTGDPDSPVQIGDDWFVTVWKKPQTPGGFRTIGIGKGNRVLSYDVGK
jgi:hypothetical protein